MTTLRKLLHKSKSRIARPDRFIIGLITHFARTFWPETDPRIDRLLDLLRSKSYARAVELADSFTELSHSEPRMHYAWNQLALLVRKVPFKDPALRPEQLAWSLFTKAEHRCKRTNQRFRAARSCHRVAYAPYLDRMRTYIQRAIGLSPDYALIFEKCGFGPGASKGVHGQATHAAAKLSSAAWTSTPSALPYARAAMKGDFHLWEVLFPNDTFISMDSNLFDEVLSRRTAPVTANTITMVPKTAKVHRTIAIEPLLNGYVQKGVDEFFRTRLRRAGIDLSDQTRNQKLALKGSKGGFNPLCTIDLSAASDSLATEVVYELLPPDWFSFLNSIRSPEYESTLGSGRYEKFTSMGNGFCFPLQTLIFASVVHSVYAETGDREFSVYGDDIIVHQSSALLVIELLRYLGFRTNVDKTFIFGPFRESCGADFFDGVPVRPYTLDFLPKTDRDIYKIYNGMRENPFFSPYEVIEYVLNHVPFAERLLRPLPGPPDTAATVPLDIFMASRYAAWCPGIQNWTWTEFISTGIVDNTPFSPGIYMYGLLRGVLAQDFLPAYTFRRKTRDSTRKVPSAPLRLSNIRSGCAT